MFAYNKSPIPYIIIDKIKGTIPSVTDMPIRVKDLAKMHVSSLNDIGLSKNLPKFTKKDRIKNLQTNIEILKFNPLILKDFYNKFNSLLELIKRKNYDMWDQCFCFNDFFINNSMKSENNIYYFDFEKSAVSCPFVDIGCVVINYPKQYDKIKSFYIENIIINLNNNNKIAKIQDYIPDLDIFVDIGICEKVIEDSAFLSDDSIKKTKNNAFCKKLAQKKIESVSFVFDNLKNSFKNGK